MHSAINLAQVVLLEAETLRNQMGGDGNLTKSLLKIETLISEQGELMFDVRKILREIASVDELTYTRLMEKPK